MGRRAGRAGRPRGSWLPKQWGEEAMWACGRAGAGVTCRDRRQPWQRGMKTGAEAALSCEGSGGAQGKGHTPWHRPGPPQRCQEKENRESYASGCQSRYMVESLEGPGYQCETAGPF